MKETITKSNEADHFVLTDIPWEDDELRNNITACRNASQESSLNLTPTTPSVDELADEWVAFCKRTLCDAPQ